MELLRKAKIYLHPMKYEHFGITMVEAMASSLVPVVHKSGGLWTDIVEFGRYGFGFKDTEEASNYIKDIIKLGEDELESLRARYVAKATIFSYKRFSYYVGKLIDIMSKHG